MKNEKAQHYLEQHLENIKDDVYPLSVVTYALHLADSPKKQMALRMLNGHKIDNEGISLKQLFTYRTILV